MDLLQKEKTMNKLKGNLMLASAAFIWGIAFVAQSVSMDHIGPWTFTCIRNFIAALTLFLLTPILDKLTKNKKQNTASKKTLVVGGVCCGIALCVASMFQQVGIMYTTVGKAGFLTALYTVIVPIISLLLGKRSSWNVYIAVPISILGMFFLCVNENFHIAYGDILVIICAFMFAIHILVVDFFAPKVDGVRLSAIQFLTAGCIAFIPMLVLEHPMWKDIVAAGVPILYAGVLSSGAGYTLQILGQREADPAIAGMILSLESVFAALAGAILLGEVLSIRELIGCLLVFGAIILSQITIKKKSSATREGE